MVYTEYFKLFKPEHMQALLPQMYAKFTTIIEIK